MHQSMENVQKSYNQVADEYTRTFRYHAAYEQLPPALLVRCRKN